MRFWLAVLFLCAALPLYAYAAEFDAAYAEQLIWAGRFQEAAQYLEDAFQAGKPESARRLCLAYALSGDNARAIHYCALITYPYWTDDYLKAPEDFAMRALAHWRAGNAKEATDFLHVALTRDTAPPWLAQLTSIAIRTPPGQQIAAGRALCEQVEAAYQQRCQLAFTAIFPEHVKKMQADSEAAARRRLWTYILAGALGPLVLLAGAAAYQYRARIAAFLRPPVDVPTAPPATPLAAPGYPAPYPSYWQAGYMNRAYQIAAYCWVTVWLLICLPLVLLLAIPAVTILLDFSATGLQSAIANAKGFAAGFLGWGRLWFGLLLLSFTGFAVTKIYGRYSLPKPFRPRIRVIRTTIRLVFLAVALLSVGTFLSYFSGVAANIYGNPLVKLLIDFIRDTLGL